MHKKDVPDAVRVLLNAMGILLNKNNGSSVWIVDGLLSGKKSLTASPDANTGLNCGLRRVAPLSYLVVCLVTVFVRSPESRITGLDRLRRSRLTTPKSTIWSMMRPIFIRMGVC